MQSSLSRRGKDHSQNLVQASFLWKQNLCNLKDEEQLNHPVQYKTNVGGRRNHLETQTKILLCIVGSGYLLYSLHWVKDCFQAPCCLHTVGTRQWTHLLNPGQQQHFTDKYDLFPVITTSSSLEDLQTVTEISWEQVKGQAGTSFSSGKMWRQTWN